MALNWVKKIGWLVGALLVFHVIDIGLKGGWARRPDGAYPHTGTGIAPWVYIAAAIVGFIIWELTDAREAIREKRLQEAKDKDQPDPSNCKPPTSLPPGE